MRYLSRVASLGDMCPETPRGRADAEKWMDWSSLNLAKFNSVFLDNYFRKSEAERSMAAIEAAVKDTSPYFDILDAHLADRDYLCGDHLTMADIPAGSLTYRWIHWAPKKVRPSHPNVEAWYARMAARPAYKEHVIEKNRKLP